MVATQDVAVFGTQDKSVTFQRYICSTVHNVYFVKYIFPRNRTSSDLSKKFEKYYPIEHIFVPACSSARKEHFFKF